MLSMSGNPTVTVGAEEWGDFAQIIKRTGDGPRCPALVTRLVPRAVTSLVLKVSK